MVALHPVGSISSFELRAIFQGLLYAGTNVISMVLAAVTNFIIRLWIIPEVFGAVNFARGIQAYIFTFNSLFNNALDREIPARLGRNDSEGAAKVQTVCYTWTTIVAGLQSVLYLVLFLFTYEFYLRLTWIILALITLMECYSNMDLISMKATQRFKAHGKALGLCSIGGSLLSIGLCWCFTEGGFFTAMIVVTSLKFIIVRSFAGKKEISFHSLQLSDATVRRVLSVGSLFLIFKLLQQVMFTVDRYFVAGFFGLKTLGLYSLGSMIMARVNQMPQSLIGSYLPRMIAKLEAGRFDEARRTVEKLQPTCVILNSLLACFFIALVEPLLAWFLPEYLPALSAIQILIIGGGLLSSASVSIQVHVGLCRFRPLIVIALVGCISAIVLCYTLRIWEMAGIATATVLATGIYGICLCFSTRMLLRVKHFITWYLVGGLALVYFSFLWYWGYWLNAAILWALCLLAAVFYLTRILEIEWATFFNKFQAYLKSSE